MRLAVYSSVASASVPNLVAVQDEDLVALPTVLVCPLLGQAEVTSFRVRIEWETKRLIACPELTRPIRRTGLYARGWLEEGPSQQILQRMQLLLAS